MADALRLSDELRDHFFSLSQVNRFAGRDARAALPDPGPAAAGAARWSAHLPRQLPAALSGLVGRDPELSAVRRLSTATIGGAGPVSSLMVIHGPPGIGKTSLAVAGAHLVSAAFPDGQLFADLRGSATGGPASVSEVLAQLLRSLAVPEAAVPAPGLAREGLLRTLLWDRRVLLVLDDAFDEAQVRPLLPANARSLVLVTSRRPLTGLDATDRIRLGVLRHEDARGMLTGLAGPPRAEADPVALDSLLRLCGGWPLALRGAGNTLASNPSWGTRHLVDRLRDRRMRLSALTAGDLDVRATLAGSYHRLSPAAASVFRSVVAIPGAGFDAGLAARAAALDLGDATVACDELVEAGLLHCCDDRYHVSELVLLFAAERFGEGTGGHGPVQERGRRWNVPYRRLHRDHLLDPGRRPASAAGPGQVVTAARGPVAQVQRFLPPA